MIQAKQPEAAGDEGVVIHEKISHKTWAEGLKEAAQEMALGNLPTIIYSSRTHSQLAQVMGELRNTGYRHAFHPTANLNMTPPAHARKENLKDKL